MLIQNAINTSPSVMNVEIPYKVVALMIVWNTHEKECMMDLDIILKFRNPLSLNKQMTKLSSHNNVIPSGFVYTL